MEEAPSLSQLSLMWIAFIAFYSILFSHLPPHRWPQDGVAWTHFGYRMVPCRHCPYGKPPMGLPYTKPGAQTALYSAEHFIQMKCSY